MKIYLIGMPGSGKTTLGQQLAGKLDLPFVDLDNEIERKEGFPIPEIFQLRGEDYFRKTEAEVLREVTGTPGSFVIATGGGAPCFFSGIDLMNSNGLTIFIDVPIPVLAERTFRDTTRPLLATEKPGDLLKKLEQILTVRRPVYEKASLKVQSPTVDSLLELIGLRN